MKLIKRKARSQTRSDVQAREAAEQRARVRSLACRVAYFVAIVLLCAVFPLFVSNAVGYVPLIVVVLLAVVSFAYLRLLVPALDYAQKTSYQECVRGEEDELVVTLKNTSPLVFFRVETTFVINDLEGGVAEQVHARTMLGAREEHVFRIDAQFAHVGTYAAGLSRIEVFDLLGLFSKTIVIEERCMVRVVPQIHELEKIGVTEITTTENFRSKKSLLSDDMDYAYVRDYELGDPMKTVHWKLSARGQDHLFTKLFESHSNPGITVFFDFRSTEENPEYRLDLFDTIIETGFSIIDYARRAGIDSSLVFRDENGIVTSTAKNNVEELDLLIDRMPRLNAHIEPRALADMMEGELRNPDAQANFIVLTSDLEEENVEGLLRMRVLRRGIRVFYAIPRNLPGDQKSARLRPMRRLSQAMMSVVPVESGEQVWKVAE